MVAPQKSVHCILDSRGHARNYGRTFGGKSYRDAILKDVTITNQKMASNEKNGLGVEENPDEEHGQGY